MTGNFQYQWTAPLLRHHLQRRIFLFSFCNINHHQPFVNLLSTTYQPETRCSPIASHNDVIASWGSVYTNRHYFGPCSTKILPTGQIFLLTLAPNLRLAGGACRRTKCGGAATKAAMLDCGQWPAVWADSSAQFNFDAINQGFYGA